MIRIRLFSFFVILITAFSCSSNDNVDLTRINQIAESYVKLVLSVGVYDPDYIDCYYGPEEWKPSSSDYDPNEIFPYIQLKKKAEELITKLDIQDESQLDKLTQLRVEFLKKQLHSVSAKIDLISGKKMSFDEECLALYDAVAPSHAESHYENLLDELDKRLPGSGDISDRIDQIRKSFIVPNDKVDIIFKTSIAECRKRVLEYIELPGNEKIDIEFVKGEPWEASASFQGDSKTQIKLNTSLPYTVSTLLWLASHESYPGHHVHYCLLEKKLFQEKEFVELSVIPLYSPISVIAEGIAQYALEIAFPRDERIKFEKTVLMPLAGLDTSIPDEHFELMHLIDNLNTGFASIEAARQYLDGNMNKKEAIEWQVKYSLLTPEMAERRLSFFEYFGGYIISYRIGQDLIQNCIEMNGGTNEKPEKRWELFYELLTTPQTPSGLLNL